MLKSALASLVISFVTASSACAQSESGDMARVVDGFYRAYETFRPPEGVPNADIRKRFAPYITPVLDELLADAADTQDRYNTLTKGKFPPLIEGDPFTPNFDGAASHVVRACAMDARGGHCEVSLTGAGGKDKPRSWVDTVTLVRADDGWRVNDIVYGANGDSGSAGTLSQTLKSSIENGNNFRR